MSISIGNDKDQVLIVKVNDLIGHLPTNLMFFDDLYAKEDGVILY